MLDWFASEIAMFAVYLVVGFVFLGIAVKFSLKNRWRRFLWGFLSILWGTTGSFFSHQLTNRMQEMITIFDSGVDTYLTYAVKGLPLAALILQFSFCAVGAGLIVNSITAEKPL